MRLHRTTLPPDVRSDQLAQVHAFPDTAFAQNVGLIGLTKVRSRWGAGWI